jgi:[acyl-carrier-protein] S-malonyltransferase
MSKKIAFLFPGQGSQVVGMGQDLAGEYAEAEQVFNLLDDICQRPLSRLCFQGPLEELTLTENLQPAVTAVSLSCLAVLHREGVKADYSAGHSVGEYAALVSAGVITAPDAIRLAKKRGELMHRESLAHPGGMVAVLGLDVEGVSAIVKKAGEDGVIALANHNTAEQIVISGDKAALARATKLAEETGAKAIPLQVSGAWHSRLMADAVEEFREFLGQIPFSAPQSIMLFNATAESETEPETIRDIMARQLLSPVKWYDSMVTMVERGVESFVEVGPKNVLRGILRKILPKGGHFNAISVGNKKSLANFLKEPR